MTLLLNEYSKLYRRKQFMLLSAVLFAFGLLALFLYERNTEEYLRRNDQSKAYIQEKEEAENAYIAEYQVFLNEMSARAERIRNSSANTANADDIRAAYRSRELDRTVSEYQKLQGIELIKGDYTAVRKYAAWLPGMLMELMFLVLLLYYAFFEDKDHNRYLLLRSTARGRKGLAQAKLLTCFCSVLIFTVLYEAAVFFVLQVLYGPVDLNAPVQSVSSFRNSPWKISILGMLVLSWALKSLVLCTVLSFLWILSMSFGKISLPVLIVSGVLGLELLLWYLIRPEGTLRIFHLVNLFSLADPRESIGSFYLLNLCSKPVRADRMAVILACTVLVILSAGGIRIFAVRNQVRKETFIEKWMLKLRAKLHVLQEGSSLFLLELYKVLIQEKRILLVLVLVIYFISLFRGVHRQDVFASAGAASYQFYAMKLQGEMDGSQEQFIKEEEARFQGMREVSRRLKEEPQDPENTMDISNVFKAAQLDAEIEIYEPGLDLVREQVRKLTMNIVADGNEEELNRQIKRFFVNEDAYSKFFMDYRTRLFRWLAAVCSLILMTAGLYATDEQSGMSTLIRSTAYGRRRLSRLRFCLMLLFMTSLYLGTEIPTTLQWYHIDGFGCFSASFSDFVSYGFRTDLKIGTVMILASVLRLLSLLLFGTASLRLSRVLKNEMTTAVVLTGIATLMVIIDMIFSIDLAGLLLKLAGVKFTW